MPWPPSTARTSGRFSGLSEVAGYVGGNSPAGAADFVVAPFSSGELVCLRLDNGRTVWNESMVGSIAARCGPSAT